MGDAFDRRVGAVLDGQADLLRELSDRLMASGSIAIERPGWVLKARLRPPAWWRRGELAVRADTEGASSSARIPLSRADYGDRAGLRSEITLQLAVQLAGLEDDSHEG